MSKRKQTKAPEPRRSVRFVTVAEVLEELGVTAQTLNDWVAKGEFPAPMRLGIRKRVWARIELEAYYKERAAQAVNEHVEVE